MEYSPFHMDNLTTSMIKKAKEELGETTERKQSSLTELRRLVQEEIENNKLICPVDDHFLLQYLRARKFDVTKTMALIKNHFLQKQNYSHLFGKADFESVRKLLNDKVYTLLPLRDEDGAIILIVRFRYLNLDEINYDRFTHAGLFIAHMCVNLHPATQICGLKTICDLRNFSLSQMTKISPQTSYHGAKYSTNGIPLRLKALYLLGAPMPVIVIWNSIKIFLSNKIRERFHPHIKNVEELHSKINPALLPEDLGGSLSCSEDTLINMKDLEEKYFELLKHGYPKL